MFQTELASFILKSHGGGGVDITNVTLISAMLFSCFPQQFGKEKDESG